MSRTGREEIVVDDGTPTAADAVVVMVLVQVAAAGIDDRTAGVFLRCWAKDRRQSSAVAATSLAEASGKFGSIRHEPSLSIVNRWIEDLAPAHAPQHGKLRRFFLGHTA